MATKIFVNMPVTDLERSKTFYQGLGFTVKPQFTDEKAACMEVSEHIYVMLLTEAFFKGFTKKQVADATQSTEMILTIDTKSKDEVLQTVAKALELGGSVYREPDDHGWMYQHSFADPDGHQWELVFMDEANIPSFN